MVGERADGGAEERRVKDGGAGGFQDVDNASYPA